MPAMSNPTEITPWHSFALRKAVPQAEPIVGHFGGHPRGIRAHQWPRCRVCGSPMCHMGQIEAGPWLDLNGFARMSLFICHATGGRCEDWDGFKGANRVLLHRVRDDSLYDGPPTVRVYRRIRLTVDPARDERTVIAAAKAAGRSRRDAYDEVRIDKLGGGAVWWHRDDTPQRKDLAGPMRLIAQLTTNIVTFDITRNGVAYVFMDPSDPSEEAAVLMWQAE